jgi:uncharacterized protein (TIGR00730 family)
MEEKKNVSNEDIRGICRALIPNERDEEFLRSVETELTLGFEFVRKHPKMVTIFGSARDKATAPYYESIRELSRRIVSETGMTIATGGGPGVMQAGNHGAHDIDPTKSIAMGIKLPMEQKLNEYVNDSMMFRYFFTRKVMMAYTADVFIACPGGFGTFDEIFEMLTLQQTHKAHAVPVIFFGTDFWAPIYDFIINTMEEKGFIDIHDESLFLMTDSVDEVIELMNRLEIKN